MAADKENHQAKAADLLGRAMPDRDATLSTANRNPATLWTVEEWNEMKRAFDSVMRFGAHADDPDHWHYSPPVCPAWEWKPEHRPQCNALLAWMLGIPCTCCGVPVTPDRGLWLAGQPGTGKTTLMRAVRLFCRTNADSRSPNLPHSMRWIHAKDVVAAYEESGVSALNELIFEVPTLIIDDVGTENMAAMRFGNVRNAVEDVLSRRYDRGKMTMVTTNLDMTDVCKCYGERIFDRVRESFNVIEFLGKSHRVNFNPEIKISK